MSAEVDFTLSGTTDLSSLKSIPLEHNSMLEPKLEVNIYAFLFGNFLSSPREGSYSRLRQGSIKGNSSEASSRK